MKTIGLWGGVLLWRVLCLLYQVGAPFCYLQMYIVFMENAYIWELCPQWWHLKSQSFNVDSRWKSITERKRNCIHGVLTFQNLQHRQRNIRENSDITFSVSASCSLYDCFSCLFTDPIQFSHLCYLKQQGLVNFPLNSVDIDIYEPSKVKSSPLFDFRGERWKGRQWRQL